jgi:hypothetical protein
LSLDIDVALSPDLKAFCCPPKVKLSFKSLRAVELRQDVEPYEKMPPEIQYVRGDVGAKDDTGLLLVWPWPDDLLDIGAIDAHRPKIVVALTGYVAERRDARRSRDPRRRKTAAGSVEFMRLLQDQGPQMYRLLRQMQIKGPGDALRCRGQQRDQYQSPEEDDVTYELSLLVRDDYQVNPELLDRIPQGTMVLPKVGVEE